MSQAQTTKEFICYSWPRRLCGRDSILMAEIRRYALSKGTNNPSPRSWESCLFVLASLVCRQYSFITLFALLVHWLLGRYLTVHSTVPLFCLAVLGASVTRIPQNPHHQPSTSTDPLVAPRVKITRLEYSLREDYLSTALSFSLSLALRKWLVSQSFPFNTTTTRQESTWTLIQGHLLHRQGFSQTHITYNDY